MWRQCRKIGIEVREYGKKLTNGRNIDKEGKNTEKWIIKSRETILLINGEEVLKELGNTG